MAVIAAIQKWQVSAPLMLSIAHFRAALSHLRR